MNQELIKLDIFKKRMKKLGIDIELMGNVPWIYIHKINGIRIRSEDFFEGNHGFTIGFLPVRADQEFHFTDIKKIFELVRKYIEMKATFKFNGGNLALLCQNCSAIIKTGVDFNEQEMKAALFKDEHLPPQLCEKCKK